MCIYKHTLLVIPLFSKHPLCELQDEQNWTHRHKDTKERIKISIRNQSFWYREYCGNFSMAAGVTAAASPKEDSTNTTKAREDPTSCLQSPKAPFFQLVLKNIVTLCAWQNREPGRLVGLPYIIGDLTNIFSSVRLCHIVQCQHFSIGTIYPRVLE